MPGLYYSRNAVPQNALGFALMYTDGEQRVEVAVDFNPSQSTVLPRYALIYDRVAQELSVAAAGYDEQSGQIIVAGPADTNGNPQFDVLAVVFDWAPPGGWPDKLRRFVALTEFDSAKGVYTMREWRNAPALVVVSDNNGNEHRIVMGFPWLAVGLLATIGTVGGIAAYGYYKKSDADQKIAEAIKKATEYAVQNHDDKVLNAVFGSVGVVYERNTNGSVWDSIQSVVKDLAVPFAALIGVMIMVFKWRIILDMFRDLFKR